MSAWVRFRNFAMEHVLPGLVIFIAGLVVWTLLFTPYPEKTTQPVPCSELRVTVDADGTEHSTFREFDCGAKP